MLSYRRMFCIVGCIVLTSVPGHADDGRCCDYEYYSGGRCIAVDAGYHPAGEPNSIPLCDMWETDGCVLCGGYTHQELCPIGYYCPGGDTAHSCGTGMTTAGTGAVSKDECFCRDGYYANGTKCTSCGKGYWCSNGVRHSCGANMTTSSSSASSSGECICADGFVMTNGVCVADVAQPPCDIGISRLYVANNSYSLYGECDTPALWIRIDSGACCANLELGNVSGIMNLEYKNQTYHISE